MLTLPRERSITLRNFDKPFCTFVQASCGNRWTEQRATVVITNKVTVESASKFACIVNLKDGSWNFADTQRFRTRDGSAWYPRVVNEVSGVIEPSSALLVLREPDHRAAGEDMRKDVAIFVDKLTADPEVDAALQVARDAFTIDENQARRLAKAALPFAFGLFMMLVRRERTWLAEQTKAIPYT